jgi:glucose/mannose transport system permease protein
MQQRTVAIVALAPCATILCICFYGFIVWTATISFTESRLLPRYTFLGFSNYASLIQDSRFRDAFVHLFVFGGLFVGASLLLGLLLAIGIDRLGTRAAAGLRMIYLFPLSVSWLVTGLVWQWILNPGLGLERAIRSMGYPGFTLPWLVRADTAIYVVAGAAVWHISGLVMALFLTGLREVDPDIWRAARVEGIPLARVYLHVILPLLRPYGISAITLLSFSVVRMFDLVVAMTGGGPGFATDLPTLYIYDSMFARGRLGQGAAASICLLLTVLVVLAPYLVIALRRR